MAVVQAGQGLGLFSRAATVPTKKADDLSVDMSIANTVVTHAVVPIGRDQTPTPA